VAAAATAAAEARDRARTDQFIQWEAAGLVPLQRDDDIEAASLASVPSELREAARAAAARAAAARSGARTETAPDASSFRRMYGGSGGGEFDGAADEPCLTTDWMVEGREPRRRVMLLQAAGWELVVRGAHGGVGSHHKWRRSLPGVAATQTITFASTPSDCFSWHNEAAQLQRRDREAQRVLAEARAAAEGVMPYREAT